MSQATTGAPIVVATEPAVKTTVAPELAVKSEVLKDIVKSKSTNETVVMGTTVKMTTKP